MTDELEREERSYFIPVLLIGVGLFIALGIWAVQSRHRREAHEADVGRIEQELAMEREKLETLRAKVVSLTEKLDAKKRAIANNQVEDRKTAVEEFNRMAAEQRAARQAYMEMGQEYNEKLSKLRRP